MPCCGCLTFTSWAAVSACRKWVTLVQASGNIHLAVQTVNRRYGREWELQAWWTFIETKWRQGSCLSMQEWGAKVGIAERVASGLAACQRLPRKLPVTTGGVGAARRRAVAQLAVWQLPPGIHCATTGPRRQGSPPPAEAARPRAAALRPPGRRRRGHRWCRRRRCWLPAAGP